MNLRKHLTRWTILCCALFVWAGTWGLACDPQKPTESKSEKSKDEPSPADKAADASNPEPRSEPAPPDDRGGNDKSPDVVSKDDAKKPDDGPPQDDPPADRQPPADTPVASCTAPSPAPSGKLCSVKGSGTSTLIVATLILEDKLLEHGQLLIDDKGKIACVGCDCKAKAPSDAKVVECPQGVVSPGLINAHDHLGWALGHPKKHGDERYDHRHDWRKGIRGKTKISSGQSNNSKEAVGWAEIRNLMAGTTSIVGSGGADGLIRNLDRNREGIPGTLKYDTFPLGDSSGKLSKSGCGSYSIVKSSSLGSYDAYVPHVSEGIDGEARNEFACVSTDQNGGQQLTTSKTAFIHGVGLRAADIALMAKNGTSLIWSPRTNVDLYGNTASIPLFLHYGVTVALGTDWPLSGSMNMLRELQCVDYLNKRHFNNKMTDQQILWMATTWAARATKTDKFIGTLKAGLLADIALFDARNNKGYRAVIDAKPQDVYLVMRQGKPLYGSSDIIESLVQNGATDCDSIDVCQAKKRLCLKGELASNNGVKDYAGLVAHLKSKNPYSLFFCADPTDEPSCLPKRPNEYGQSKPDDKDGDGVADGKDNCPDVFNPIRPMDDGKQADADSDGKGDVCDPCPLTANSTTCKKFDPNDRDGDGVPNAKDNCPGISNPKQENKDGDAYGDACDACPEAKNSPTEGCPTTIYDLKNKKVAFGTAISLKNALITARTANGDRIALQVGKNDAGYKGAEFSGIIVYLGNTTVKPLPAFKAGDRVSLQGKVQNFNDQIQIADVNSLTVTPGTETVAPVVVNITDVHKKSSPKAVAYEGVLVEIKDVEVVNQNPDTPRDFFEWSVAKATDKTNDIRIDDQFDTSSYTGSRSCRWNTSSSTGTDSDCFSPNKCQCPLTSCTQSGDGRCYPTGGTATADKRKVGDKFKVIRGVLVFTFGNFKITPRSAADLQQ